MTEVRATDPVTGGQKGQKPEAYALIPVEALAEVARVYGYGATKYSENNWRKGYPWSWSYSALQRHLNAFWSGENWDKESTLPHLAHAAFHIFALLTYSSEAKHRANDDRQVVPDDVSVFLDYLADLTESAGAEGSADSSVEEPQTVAQGALSYRVREDYELGRFDQSSWDNYQADLMAELDKNNITHPGWRYVDAAQPVAEPFNAAKDGPANLLVAAVDFDGTLAESLWTPENRTSEIGEPIWSNVDKLDELYCAGYEIVVHTARPASDELAIQCWFDYHQIAVDRIVTGKPLAAVYVDDRAVRAEDESWLPT